MQGSIDVTLYPLWFSIGGKNSYYIQNKDGTFMICNHDNTVIASSDYFGQWNMNLPDYAKNDDLVALEARIAILETKL